MTASAGGGRPRELERVLDALLPGRAPSPFADDFAAELALARALHAEVPYAHAVARSGADAPERARELLTRARMWLALLDHEAERAIRALSAAGLEVIVLKGMDLAHRVYASPLERPMTDVDLLVRPGELERAIAALEAEGYLRAGTSRAGRFRLEMRRADTLPIVELHDRLAFGDTDEYLAGLWSRARAGVIPGLPREARALADEDGFVYLARHAGVQHLLESPLWMNDLHRLACRGTLDWNVIAPELDRRGRVAGWFLLSMLARHWNAPVPAFVLERLGSRISPVRRRWLERWTDPGNWFDPRRRGAAWAVRMRLLLRDDWRDALGYAGRFIQYRLPPV